MDNLLKHIEFDIGKILSIENLDLGLVHKILKLKFEGEVFILKIRGNCYITDSKIVINPRDIDKEIIALEFLNSCRGLTPIIIKKYPLYNAFLMTEIAVGGEPLVQFLQKKELDSFILKKLLEAVTSVLEALKSVNVNPSDLDFVNFKKILLERFGFIDSILLNSLIQEMLKNINCSQYLHGGLSFKNILISQREIGFCDFETFCFGNTLFEWGYLWGHILLHSVSCVEDLLPLLEVIYKKQNEYAYFTDKSPLLRIILGTIIYRLDHPKITYPKTNGSNFWMSHKKQIIILLNSNKILLETIGKTLEYV